MRVLPILAGALLLAACTSAPQTSKAGSTSKPVVYVAVGASESVGVGLTDPLVGAWTQRFYRDSLKPSAVFVNMAVPASTAMQALQAQVPTAASLKPTVATVWLNVNDVFDGVDPVVYGRQLRSIVSTLSRGGAATVLVANTPPLQLLPGYLNCLSGQERATRTFSCPTPVPTATALQAVVAAYNAQIASVTSSTGALLVNLNAAYTAAERGGTTASLVGPDGINPSNAGQALVAHAFAAALARAHSAS
ncbi:MAG TPA: GDSL-type esterase/lipase family protein [Acidimicrobiales bacterium]|nr:GDSL-type esterase/lipase family protein [Acidimicrobiales bacterium]